MKKEFKTEQEIDAILNSIDNIKQAEAPPYFYTRLTVRMGRSKAPLASRLMQLLSKPVVGISVLVLFLVLNVVAIKGIMAAPKVSQSNLSDVQSFATEYNLNTTSVYSN
jgi:hypothetical protein